MDSLKKSASNPKGILDYLSLGTIVSIKDWREKSETSIGTSYLYSIIQKIFLFFYLKKLVGFG